LSNGSLNRMDSRAIRSVAIAGGGIVGWSAAAALKRRLPALSVSVIAIAPADNALAERVTCTLPSIVDFHGDLGLSEADTVLRAGSGYRLGTRFEGWADADYVHAYGGYGRSIGSVPFHQHWSRAVKGGAVAPFDCYSVAAVIARHNRFALPEAVARAGLGTIGYGLHIDLPRYREMMRAFGLHLGVAEIIGPISDVRLSSGDGSIEMVEAAGHEIAADLYVDATGPGATLRSRLDDQWEGWSEWLPADRVLFAESESAAEPSLLDKVVATSAGWRWRSAAPGRTSHGYVYSSQHLTDSDAEGALRDAEAGVSPEKPITIRQGRWSQPWLRNCVAIGDAAVAVEPLEWTNLHLAHGAIDRLVAMMPDRDFSTVELWDYNRQVCAEADRVRDFLVLHYATANDQSHGDFGNDVSANLPPSLDHTLGQFRERGRLPFYEEETFSRDSWLAVLLGQSVIPKRIDPLADAIAPATSERAMAELREAISNFVDRLPKYSDHLEQLGRKAA
jgi:tryptophan halogenase